MSEGPEITSRENLENKPNGFNPSIGFEQDIKKKITDLTKKLEKLNEDFSALNQEALQGLRDRLSVVEEKLEEGPGDTGQLQQKLESLEGWQERNRNDIQILKDSNREVVGTLGEMVDFSNVYGPEMEKNISDLRKEVGKLRNEKADISTINNLIEKRGIAKNISSLKEEVGKLKNTKSETLTIQNFFERLWWLPVVMVVLPIALFLVQMELQSQKRSDLRAELSTLQQELERLQQENNQAVETPEAPAVNQSPVAKTPGPEKPAAPPPDLLSPTEARDIIANRARYAMTYIKDVNFNRLAFRNYVYAPDGLRLYRPGSSEAYYLMSDEEMRTAAVESPTLRWEGNGQSAPVESSFLDYFFNQLYDGDFLNAAYVQYNELSAGSPYDLGELAQAFPDAILVEYGSASDPQGSLLMVFQQHDEKWYLKALLPS